MAQVQDISTGTSTGQYPHVQDPTGEFQVVTQPVLATPPNDFMLLSIFSCLFLWPIAGIAICFSYKARNAYYQGKIWSAKKYRHYALGLSIGSIVGGIILISIVLPLQLN